MAVTLSRVGRQQYAVRLDGVPVGHVWCDSSTQTPWGGWNDWRHSKEDDVDRETWGYTHRKYALEALLYVVNAERTTSTGSED